MNSSSPGSMSHFVDIHLPCVKRAKAIAAVTGKQKLTPKQCKLATRLLDKHTEEGRVPGKNLRDLTEAIFSRRELWNALHYHFRFESVRLVTMVRAIRDKSVCCLCGNYTTRIAVCKICLLKDPKAAKDAFYAYRKEKSAKTFELNHPEGWGNIVAGRIKTNRAKYGTDHPAQNAAVKAKTAKSWLKVDRATIEEKRKTTCREKYGVDHAMQASAVSNKARASLKKLFSDNEKKAEIVARRKSTYKTRSGYESPRQNPEVIERAAATYEKRTGYTHNMRNPDSVAATRAAHMSKYGCSHPMQRAEVKLRTIETTIKRHGGLGKASDATRKKIETTNVARYGHEVATANPLIMAKCKATWLLKYGFENPNKNPEQAAKGLRSSFHREDVEVDGRKFTVQGSYEVVALKALCKKYGALNVFTQFSKNYPRLEEWTPDFWVRGVGYFECKSTWTLTMPSALAGNRKKAKATKDCTWLVVHDKSVVKLPKKWYRTPNVEYVWQQAYFDKIGIDRHCEPYLSLIASWIPGAKIKRQVIYTDKIAIMFIPLYWQKSAAKLQAFKTKAELSGRRAVFIYEHWLRLRRVATRNFILNLTGRVRRTVFARNCEVEVKPISEVKSFLNTYHIQGSPLTGKAYCLMYEGSIVGCMVFNHTTSNRGSKKTKGAYELTRFATSASIPGGASRLLKAHLKRHEVISIVSYSDNSLFTGSMYKKLGFEKTKETKADYYAWVGGLLVKSKQFYSRATLAKNWPDDFNPDLTEAQNCEAIGLRTILTLGKTRWELRPSA